MHRLIVDRRCWRTSRRELRVLEPGMALQAELIQVVASQQARICGAVRGVAESASLGLYHGMFIDEGTGILLVAFDADGIVLRGRMGHAFLEGSVGIVAVSALHQAFIDFVMEGLGKGGFHIFVTGVAESWLWLLEQESLLFGLMNAMAVNAGNFCFAVCGAVETRVIALMALQTTLFHDFGRGLSEAKYFRRITGRLHMSFARPMTSFAGNSGSSMLEGEF